MTRDEWCHAALHRTPITVAMEGIPDAHAVLIGWHAKRGCHVRFASGAKAVVRQGRVTFPLVADTIGATSEARAVVAAGPLTGNPKEAHR